MCLHTHKQGGDSFGRSETESAPTGQKVEEVQAGRRKISTGKWCDTECSYFWRWWKWRGKGTPMVKTE